MTVAISRDDGGLRQLVTDSGLFDPAWYRDRYPDVAISGIDPLQHYLRYGRHMGRSPGPDFDPAWYVAENPDVATTGLDPLCHFVRFGRVEGRLGKRAGAVPGRPAAGGSAISAVATVQPRLLGHLDRVRSTTMEGWAIDEARPGEPVPLVLCVDGEKVLEFSSSDRRSDVCAKGMPGDRAGFVIHVPPGVLRSGQRIEVRDREYGRCLKGSPKVVDSAPAKGTLPIPVFLPARSSGALRPVSVVVPIYNAPDAVSVCLESLRKCALPENSEVLMLDDGSTDPRIAGMLALHAGEAGFRLERNPSNLGYTRTVNRALELCPGRDVVLLNSDTRVTPRWLHNLRYCAYSQPDIGTVTALSDNAGAFSVPEFGVANARPLGLGANDMALAVIQAGEGLPIDVPTGNGFCMYLRRDALDQAGGFDERKYPAGYGEENDLCMHLLYAGWRNVVCDKAYVFHLRTQSFGARKQALVEQGARRLAVDHPEYKGLTGRFRDLDFEIRRARIRRALVDAVSNPPCPRILFVISTNTGGTPQTNLDLMRAISNAHECFLLRSDSLTLTLSRLVDGQLVEIESVSLHFPILPMPHRSAEYDRIVADMLYRHSIDLMHVRHVAWHGLGLAAAAKALQIPVIFSVHDFYSLCPSVNLLDTEYRYCGTDPRGARINPLWPRHAIPDGFVPRWRRMMDAFLRECDAFVTTAPSAAALFSQVYPEHGERLRVIPHGRDFTDLEISVPLPVPGRALRVLVPGNISVSKGARLLAELEKLDEEGSVELHFLGNVCHDAHGVGVRHGSYKREEFRGKVQEIAPHVGVVLSIWPETFCHTLTEMWSCGVPVLGLDIGAVGDRIRATGGGWLLPPDATAAEVLNELRRLAAARDEVAERQADIARWQTGEALVHGTAHMASGYRQLYREVLRPGCGKMLRVGLVMRSRGRADNPPTAHIRLRRPLLAATRRGGIDARPVSVEAIVAGAAEAFDVVVVQRDAVPSKRVDAVVGALSKAAVPWVFEIDDRLWDLPDDHRDHDIDAAAVQGMLKIARGASCVTTSTPVLAASLAEFNGRVELVSNAPDERLWCAPLAEGLPDVVARELGLDRSQRYILYMGSRSHGGDLEMIVPAIERIIEHHPDVQVLQIGGGHPLPFALEVSCPSRYSSYPDFVAWFRAVCSHCTLALAPLLETPFNRSKSDIKWLDYALAGVPAVLSDFGPYPDSVEDGVTGVLCSASAEDWVQAIGSLLEDADLRQGIRRAAHEAAMTRTLQSSDVAEKWLALLGSAAGRAGVG